MGRDHGLIVNATTFESLPVHPMTSVLFEALNMMAAVEDALSALHAVYMTDKESGSERPEERSKAYQSLITCERS